LKPVLVHAPGYDLSPPGFDQLLGDLVAVQNLLVQYVEAAPEQQAVLLRRIKGELGRLQTRLATNESCVSARAPEPPRAPLR